jgi:DNA-binding IclR family transcriptional regulator
MIDVADWVRAGRAQGLSVSEIARLARISRETAHQILRVGEKRDPR